LKVFVTGPGFNGANILWQMVREFIPEYLCEVQSSMFRKDHDVQRARRLGLKIFRL
jgi:hypothetical protein